MWGRGFFYVLTGTFAMTSFDAAQGWTAFGGFCVLGAGVCNVVLGILSERGMAAAAQMPYEQALDAFAKADANGDGELDGVEFPAMMRRFGVKLNRLEMEAAFMSMDLDGDGKLSKAEFVEWWQSRSPTQEPARRAPDTQSLLINEVV